MTAFRRIPGAQRFGGSAALTGLRQPPSSFGRSAAASPTARGIFLPGAMRPGAQSAIARAPAFPGYPRQLGPYRGRLVYAGVLYPAQITANTNNYNPSGAADAAVMWLTSDGRYRITGLAGGYEGRVVHLGNANAAASGGGFSLDLRPLHASSSAENQFNIPGLISLWPQQIITLTYRGAAGAGKWVADEDPARVITPMMFGGDPISGVDQATAIQKALDHASGLDGSRGTVHIPSTLRGSRWQIATGLVLNAQQVSILADSRAIIQATAAMAALLTNATGIFGVSHIEIIGGVWDANFLATRCIWIKEGTVRSLRSFNAIKCGAFVDGINETETSYIELGDTVGGTSGGANISDFLIARNDWGAAASDVPAQNIGIRMNNSGDNIVMHGVISGIKKGVYGGCAHTTLGFLHFWNYSVVDGKMDTAIHATAVGGVHVEGCQFDLPTDVVGVKVEGTARPSSIFHNKFNVGTVAVDEGADNTGYAFEIGAGGMVIAGGNMISCDPAHRYATNWGGDLSNLILEPGFDHNVVAPYLGQTRIAKNLLLHGAYGGI